MLCVEGFKQGGQWDKLYLAANEFITIFAKINNFEERLRRYEVPLISNLSLSYNWKGEQKSEVQAKNAWKYVLIKVSPICKWMPYFMCFLWLLLFF